MRLSAAYSVAVLLCTALPSLGQGAPKPLWTLTCTLDGKAVYVARVPDDKVRARSLEVQSGYPGAICVSIGAETAAPLPMLDGVAAAPPPGSAPRSLPPPNTGNPMLDAALHAIRGDRVPVAPPKTAPPADAAAPESPSVAYEKPATAADLVPKSGEWVRLGVYRGADEADVRAAWLTIARADPRLFGSMTPDIEGKGNLVALIAGPVQPRERVDVCLAAMAQDLDCVFGNAEKPDDDAVSMRDFLAFAGADPSPWCARRAAAQIRADEAAGEEVSTSGRQCWASRFALAEAERLASAPPLHEADAPRSRAPSAAAAKPRPRPAPKPRAARRPSAAPPPPAQPPSAQPPSARATP